MGWTLNVGPWDPRPWTLDLRSCFVLTMGRPFPNLCMLSKKHGKSIWDPDVENWTLQSIGDCINWKIHLETLSWQLNLVEYLWEVEILLWRIYLKKLSIGGWAEVISWSEEIFWKHYMDNYTLQSINGQVGFRESIKTKLLCKVLGCRWVGGWSEVIYPDLENLSEKFTF